MKYADSPCLIAILDSPLHLWSFWTQCLHIWKTTLGLWQYNHLKHKPWWTFPDSRSENSLPVCPPQQTRACSLHLNVRTHPPENYDVSVLNKWRTYIPPTPKESLLPVRPHLSPRNYPLQECRIEPMEQQDSCRAWNSWEGRRGQDAHSPCSEKTCKTFPWLCGGGHGTGRWYFTQASAPLH